MYLIYCNLEYLNLAGYLQPHAKEVVDHCSKVVLVRLVIRAFQDRSISETTWNEGKQRIISPGVAKSLQVSC